MSWLEAIERLERYRQLRRLAEAIISLPAMNYPKRKESNMTLVKGQLVKINEEGEFFGLQGRFVEYSPYPIAIIAVEGCDNYVGDEKMLEIIPDESTGPEATDGSIPAEQVDIPEAGTEEEKKTNEPSAEEQHLDDPIVVEITAPDTQFQGMKGKLLKSLGNGTSQIDIEGKLLIFGDDEFEPVE